MQAAHTVGRIPRWARIREKWRLNPRLLITMTPVVVFYVLSVVAPPTLAVAGGFAAAAGAFYFTRKSRLYQALLLVGFAVVALTAAIGITWGSEKAYLASGACSSFLFAFIYSGSVLIRHPLVGGIAREVVPGLTGRLPDTAPVFVWTTLAWAVFSMSQGFVRVYLLVNLSVGEYIIWSRVVGYPATGLMLGATAYFIWRTAEKERKAAATEANSVSSPRGAS